MAPRSTPAFLESEPSVVEAARELERLFRRARRRTRATLLYSLIATLLAMAAYVVKERTFAPRVILRVVEPDRDPSTAPRPNRRLREHVRDTVFSSKSLFDVMKRHGLYPTLLRKNPRGALESFREDIVIDVYRNYFIEERSANDPPRSARIAIGYRSEDPRQAVAVARDLGRLVVAYESQRRREQAAMALQNATDEAVFARTMLASRQELINERSRELTAAHDDRTWLELLSLSSSLQTLHAEVERAERMKAELELGAAFEQGGLGLRFDIVDGGAVRAREAMTVGRILRTGVLDFFLLLPFVALGVGAFTRGIDDEEDVERLGLPVIGTVVPLEIERGSDERTA